MNVPLKLCRNLTLIGEGAVEYPIYVKQTKNNFLKINSEVFLFKKSPLHLGKVFSFPSVPVCSTPSITFLTFLTVTQGLRVVSLTTRRLWHTSRSLWQTIVVTDDITTFWDCRPEGLWFPDMTPDQDLVWNRGRDHRSLGSFRPDHT